MFKHAEYQYLAICCYETKLNNHSRSLPQFFCKCFLLRQDILLSNQYGFGIFHKTVQINVTATKLRNNLNFVNNKAVNLQTIFEDYHF